MTPADFVVDGGGVACLGLRWRDGARRADLRKPLALAREIARAGGVFRCLFDRNLPHRVREEDRGLLDLLLAEHPDAFSMVPQGGAADDHLLQRAGATGAAVVAASALSGEAAYLDRYPWLADPGRLLLATERDGLLACGGLAETEYLDSTAFDLYDALLPTLLNP